MVPTVVAMSQGMLLNGRNPMVSGDFEDLLNPTFYTSDHNFEEELKWIGLEIEHDYDYNMEKMQEIIGVYPEAGTDEVNSQYTAAPAVKTEFNRIATPPIPPSPMPAATHPAQLVVEESLNLQETTVIDQDNCTRCYWRGERRLYIKPGEEFSLTYQYDSPSGGPEGDDIHLEVYPVYEDEEHSHAPVLRCDSDRLGILELVEGSGCECVGLGARCGVRVRAQPRRARLRLHMWDDRTTRRRRGHLNVALYFILFDALGRCRGLDKIQVRVSAKPERKRKHDKKKLEKASMTSPSETPAPAPVAEAPAVTAGKRRKRQRRAPSFDDSDNEPLGQNTAETTEVQTIDLQLRVPVTLEGKHLLDTVHLSLGQCVQRGSTQVALFQRNLAEVANIIREHYAHF